MVHYYLKQVEVTNYLKESNSKQDTGYTFQIISFDHQSMDLLNDHITQQNQLLYCIIVSIILNTILYISINTYPIYKLGSTYSETNGIL